MAGFVILGAALAGMFPALIAITPQRIGERRAQHAIAWQVGAAAAGGSGISALLGLLIDTTSLASSAPLSSPSPCSSSRPTRSWPGWPPSPPRTASSLATGKGWAAGEGQRRQ